MVFLMFIKLACCLFICAGTYLFITGGYDYIHLQRNEQSATGTIKNHELVDSFNFSSSDMHKYLVDLGAESLEIVVEKRYRIGSKIKLSFSSKDKEIYKVDGTIAKHETHVLMGIVLIIISVFSLKLEKDGKFKS